MVKTNIAHLRSHLSALLDRVQAGDELEIQKRNVTIARVVPVKQSRKNKTRPGSGKDSVKFLGDVVRPAFEDDWEMNQ